MTLAELAAPAPAREHGGTTLSLTGPVVRYRSLNTTEFAAASMDWCAQLWMSVDEVPGYDDEPVCVGCADFLTVRLGRELVGADVLDSYSKAAEAFSPLFEGRRLAEAVAEQFDAMPINDVVIILSVELAAPVRGHGLGAWMVTEIGDRMLSSHDGLLLGYPDTDDSDSVARSDRFAAKRLDRYWRGTGVVPITACPGFLGQASAYTALGEARDALAATAQLSIEASASELAHCDDRYDHDDHR